MTESKIKKLKLVSLIGGIYEIIFGFLLTFFIVPLLNLLGLDINRLDYPIFAQTAGLLAIIIGLMLSFSAFNVEKYLLNILLIIILRLAIQIVIYINIVLIPTIGLGLLIFGLIDLFFAIISLYLIKASGLKFNIFKIIK
ncbi:MAG: hypothetical protein ACFFCV_00400 [Promethearchaeota archaeon]